MLPAQNQEPQNTQNTMATATFQTVPANASIPPSALTHRRRVSNIESRPRKRQYTQEFQPYPTVAPGLISRHRKHRSQPVNFLDDPTLLMSPNGLSYTTAAASSAMMGRKFGNFLQENRIPEGNVTQNLGARQRSMSEVNLQQGFLQDVTGGITNTQDLSSHQMNQTVTPRSLSGMNFMPITPGSPFVGILPQQTPTFSQQVPQQALSNQFVLSPGSTVKPAKRPFPPLSTNIRSIPPPPDLVEKIKSHMRRHSVDTTPVVRNMDSYFVNLGSTSSLPSPPNSAPLVTTNAFDMAPMPSRATTSISHIAVPEEGSFDDELEGDDESYFSPSGSSAGHSPECPSSPQMHSIDSVLSSEKLHQALQSVASRQTGESADSAQLKEYLDDQDDETRVPGGFVRASGISNDEISAYISGPEPADNKWVCLYPECQKRFGRKENIKSHVQTHLGDRQFRCEVCKKCFVRQHDLKRHAKIHTGIKPYPCKCGNSFARHDALTRHRQRGMCIGAFEGIVKKVVKRGRPKKIRAEGEPETPKKRRRNKKRPSEGGMSSESGASISSGSDICASSPSACDDIDTWETPTSPVLRLLETVPEIAPNQPPATGKRKREASSEPENEDDHKRERLDSVSINSFTEFGPVDFGLPAASPLYSAPSTPEDMLGEVSPTTTTAPKQGGALGFCDPLLNSFDEDTSFTPEGSPDLQVLHRKYASAFNTPEWEGLSAPAIAADEVDLREILGLPDLETSSAAATASTDTFPFLGNGKEIHNDISLSNLNTLNGNFDLGLSGEEFDFIKPELLQESDVLDMQLWQNLQGEY
ncbi:Metallothionein expression activator [Orbilia oligospora]|uniref:Metallothionein expression activator n=1 Tax=Orbilia oligospora TaxID=2813651 RepID=A0A7C8PJE4_ORBOL|nr:Metallothionein expression activator [Orbilia oligospora]KAF3220566.1 Metallothionein expression activator [Orbilia oligospora]